MSKTKAPAHLKAAGKSLWESIAGPYDLRPDELTILDSACRTADRLTILDAAWVESGMPMLTKGSMGQEVIHPLVGELRTHESALASLLARLKLPDEPGGERANQHRDAANSRWAQAHGAGA